MNLEKDRRHLAICQTGYEALMVRELELTGTTRLESGPGWALIRDDREKMLAGPDWCFAHQVLVSRMGEITGDSVNSLAGQLTERFLASLRGEQINEPWPLVFSAAGDADGLGRRVRAVHSAFAERMRKRLARVMKFAEDGLPRGVGKARGLFVVFTDFGRAFASREVWLGGQRRMADDAQAPSRSYLKTEEAFVVLGREPHAGESVADLGAAPGGWSYSAAKRGANVVAVDNGPLKAGAANHPAIEHRKEDAFKFRPAPGVRYDWLFCDLVEQPNHVLELATMWLAGGWCRQFVINLKFGRVDPFKLRADVSDPERGLSRFCRTFAIRHLYHDREEFTLVGELAQ